MTYIIRHTAQTSKKLMHTPPSFDHDFLALDLLPRTVARGESPHQIISFGQILYLGIAGKIVRVDRHVTHHRAGNRYHLHTRLA